MAKIENKKDNTKGKKAIKNNPPKKPINSSLSLEITSILIICFSILLIISIFFGSGGFLGKALSSLFKGLFGIGAYLLPIIMIVCSVYVFFSQNNKINIFKVVLSIIVFILLITFFHIATRQDISSFSNYFTYLANEYKTAKFLDGGVLGALVGDLFLKVLGVLASYIFIIILFIASIFLLTGKSFFTSVYKWFKNLSNYFYYEYDIEEEYEEDINLPVKKNKNIISKIKNIMPNKSTYYEDEQEEIYETHNKNNYLENEYKKPTIKRYNNYIFDGTYKYRRIQKPVFFDMSKAPKNNKDRKIIFAIDEINNPEKYRNITYNKPLENNFNNNDTNNTNIINNLKEENIYNTTANVVKNFENTSSKSSTNDDLFKIKSKEEYINNVYMKKKTDTPINREFDIDLKFIDNNIDDIFENPPEQFLSDNVESNYLNNLDNFYNFNEDDDIEEELQEVENIEEKAKFENLVENNEKIVYNEYDEETKYDNIIDDTLNEEIITNDLNSTINNDDCPFDIEDNNLEASPIVQNNSLQNKPISNIKKDKDDFTIINQDSHKSAYQQVNNNNIKNLDKTENINEPVIIKPDVEKMVTSAIVEEDIKREYIFPKLDFLSKNPNENNENNDIELRENSYILVKTLKSFNVTAQVINISKGPSVTRYELSIEDGIKVSKILGLADNLALSLAASSIRIEAPIPGKSAVGIEIPNKEVKSVFLSEVICAEKFQKFPSKVAFGLGKDITGNVIVTDIAKMPHMLIAGATGSGKSVCINTLITSILYKANPNEVKLMMIDPKVVELSVYNGIPHLLTPVVTEPEKAAGVLNWAVSEMMERYNLFAQTGTRNLVGYNSLIEEKGEEKLPQIIIIIDELADLMMVAAKEVEASICRLAQLARAAGIHLIIATQRPSVDVITGLIKANIPSRIAFAVSSGTDSRTVLDTVGAEKLLGKGDMLFRSVDMNKPLRIQGAFISDKEVEHIVTFIKENSSPNYDETIINKIENSTKSNDSLSSDSSDEITEDVIAFLVKKGKASTSMIQRQFRIGYNRAARIIEELEDRGIVSSENGSKQRDVLMDRYQYEEYLNRYNNY
ncbi:FtsK/SpoIIIE family DNA translocase [[Clostridium] colinum]|uniref:FtsK/SpoIIIE family DNA translocase n=1 Tax=[Clostridium] colinum TaxID=36835 RepID=UPI0020256B02|nr:DNA translocase FtsK [[Clostridium] colinum]